jgi:hypothetical protein
MSEWLIIVIVGAVFVILGVAGYLWGIREERRIFEALSKKPDLREFTQKHIETPQPGALKTGGRIAVILGTLLVVVGIIFWAVG